MTTPHPRLSINQATIKYTTVAQAIDVVSAAGIQSIGLWREQVQEAGLNESVKMIADSGLRYSTHCRGGWFTAEPGPARQAALNDNRVAIDETAALAAAGAAGSKAALVIVVGGLPEGSRDIVGARERVRDAVATLAPHAEANGVQLALEPLHPMYCSDRAVLSTLDQALDIAADFAPEVVGVTVDTFHLWWDPDVFDKVARAGREGRIASYQVCDWKTPLAADVLLSRHYPGDGVIDFAAFTKAVEATGYTGDVEVELLSQEIWDTDPAEAVRRTIDGFERAVAPFLSNTPVS
ncbi:sugar phosphate isomerase/epimerase family protein [Microbacterium amylolyticum]|uniref:Sugar phosphate isomerase/epimerase n=1 Tax=Microbacterium amylolyticum TaxID=936337 RepID=A0ABS4ZIC7_9MICO|nr:sugar phosphate isomerase/epimerase family protein [Microbacterium amylolyticum]MBP2437016.1 sugar phosphate isomerase/epimerase [Microbacterium amylolyticum]